MPFPPPILRHLLRRDENSMRSQPTFHSLSFLFLSFYSICSYCLSQWLGFCTSQCSVFIYSILYRFFHLGSNTNYTFFVTAHSSYYGACTNNTITLVIWNNYHCSKFDIKFSSISCSWYYTGKVHSLLQTSLNQKLLTRLFITIIIFQFIPCPFWIWMQHSNPSISFIWRAKFTYWSTIFDHGQWFSCTNDTCSISQSMWKEKGLCLKTCLAILSLFWNVLSLYHARIELGLTRYPLHLGCCHIHCY